MSVTDWKNRWTGLLAAAACRGGFTTYDEHRLDRAASRKKPNSVSGITDI
jgi:hypothetical protein